VSASQQHHRPLPIPLPTHSLQVDVTQASSSAAFVVLSRQHLLQSRSCCAELCALAALPAQQQSAASTERLSEQGCIAARHLQHRPKPC
jgi:hypothetical protein